MTSITNVAYKMARSGLCRQVVLMTSITNVAYRMARSGFCRQVVLMQIIFMAYVTIGETCL